jgi:hypothetical protein
MSLATQASFNIYSPASIGWSGQYDPEKHPDLLTKFEFDGVSFGSMHKLVVPIFTDLLTQLVPLIPGGLVKGTCGCYNPGSVTVDGDRSFHTYAIAIDVNWGANPMYAGQPHGQHALPPKTSSIARKFGCEWGGDWSYPQDFMHLEVHLSPAECIAYAKTRKPAAKPTAPDPLEEIMAFYKNRPEFEAAMRNIVRSELNKGVNMAHVLDDTKPGAFVRIGTWFDRHTAAHPKPGAK